MWSRWLMWGCGSFCVPLQILSKTSESKGKVEKAIAKATVIIAEVDKSGKSAEKTLKAELVSQWHRFRPHTCPLIQWRCCVAGIEMGEGAVELNVGPTMRRRLSLPHSLP